MKFTKLSIDIIKDANPERKITFSLNGAKITIPCTSARISAGEHHFVLSTEELLLKLTDFSEDSSFNVELDNYDDSSYLKKLIFFRLVRAKKKILNSKENDGFNISFTTDKAIGSYWFDVKKEHLKEIITFFNEKLDPGFVSFKLDHDGSSYQKTLESF